MNPATLSLPLYHGTSSLFLEDILALGLGAKNPLEELRLLDFIDELRPLIDEHLCATTDYKSKSATFALMAEQASRGMNFQHGQTYLSPSAATALRYAANKRYGSEILTYALDFLQMLVDREVPSVVGDLYRRYPNVFALLDISPAPILVRVCGVPMQSLQTEMAADPVPQVKQLLKLQQEQPDTFSMVAQQLNFRLIAPLPPSSGQVWFINVTRWDPFSPEYRLHELKASGDEVAGAQPIGAAKPSSARGLSGIG